MSQHIITTIRQLVAEGLSPGNARAASSLTFRKEVNDVPTADDEWTIESPSRRRRFIQR